MKILHYSDRGSPDFLKLYQECDILISTGDLMYQDFAGIENLPKKPSFGVYGNHDSGNYLESLGITNLHNKVVEFGGVKWGGFQGCIKYKESPLMYTDEEAKAWADSFPYVDILLLHAGPKNMLDDPSDEIHTGSEHIKRYVLEKRPKLIFVGHQYSDAQMEFEGIKIYRTYGARIINI